MKSKVIRLNNDEIDELDLVIELAEGLYQDYIRDDIKHERYYRKKLEILSKIRDKLKIKRCD